MTTLSVFDLLDAGVQPKTRTLVIFGEDDDTARRGEYFCPGRRDARQARRAHQGL